LKKFRRNNFFKATDAVLDEISNATKQSSPPKLNLSAIKLNPLHLWWRWPDKRAEPFGLSLIFFGSFFYQEKKEQYLIKIVIPFIKDMSHDRIFRKMMSIAFTIFIGFNKLD